MGSQTAGEGGFGRRGGFGAGRDLASGAFR